MSRTLTTVVTFQSNRFNKTESRDYFINPDCFGDDTCEFLIRELEALNVDCDSRPTQEDWGWCFHFRVRGLKYLFGCGLRRDWPVEAKSSYASVDEGAWDEAWICFVKRDEKNLLSILGLSKQAVEFEAVDLIHRALSSSGEIAEILWHDSKDFDTGNEALGTAAPRAQST